MAKPIRSSGSNGSDAAVPSALHRTWWIPVVFVALALGALLAAPVFASRRIQQLRHDGTDVSDQGLVIVNDFEAAFATELYLRSAVLAGSKPRADRLLATILAQERQDERALDTLTRRLGPEAAARFAELRLLTHQWHAEAAGPGSLGGSLAGIETVSQPPVLVAAESLDRLLSRIAADYRTRIRYYEHLEVLTAVALAPVALLAIGVVLWGGQWLFALTRVIERDRATLASAMRARTALIHGVTHDVKNPLGAALGYAELLEEGIHGDLSAEQLGKIRRIRRLVQVALSTVAELLDVARAEAGALPLVQSDLDLGPLLEEIRGDYQAAAQAKNITLHAHAPAERSPVRTDEIRVRRILGNLLSNAIKYTPPGGRVDLMVSPNGGSQQSGTQSGGAATRVGITVQDSGPGVAPSLRERIFDEFFRAPAVEGSTSGTGLGLAISRRFARALGGDIEVAEGPGGGAAFTLWLPA